MGDLEKLVAELRDALAKATPGPWGVDSAYDDDAVYSGGGGCGRGFKNFFIGAEVRGKWATLLDSVNSDEKLIDEEYDEDGKSAWDEIGRNNANFVAIARNNLPALLDALSAKDAEITSLRAEVERMREANVALKAEVVLWAQTATRFENAATKALRELARRDEVLAFDPTAFPGMEEAAIKWANHIAGERGKKPNLPDPVAVLEMCADIARAALGGTDGE